MEVWALPRPLALVRSLLLAVLVNGAPQLTANNTGCHKLDTELLCLSSRDGRTELPFKDSPCEWCCGLTCTQSGNKCEPKSWLRGQSGYGGNSKNGIGENTCPKATCNVTAWSNVKKSCSSCRALVDGMDSDGPFRGMCSNYCAAQGLRCVAQQEDDDSNCIGEWTGSCTIPGKQNGASTDDLICQCERQEYSCSIGPGSSCKTCVDVWERTTNNECASCNRGYYNKGGTCEAQLTGNNAGCNTLQNEWQCLAAKDGRLDLPYGNSPCQWCCGNKCTETGNKCEPRVFLLTSPGNRTYVGKSKNGLGEDTCRSGNVHATTDASFSPTPSPSPSTKGTVAPALPSSPSTSLVASTCDEFNWPDQYAECGDCKVLINRFASHYKTCAGYCNSLGRGCVGAWEEASNTCEVEAAMSCNEERSTTDAICECTRMIPFATTTISAPSPSSTTSLVPASDLIATPVKTPPANPLTSTPIPSLTTIPTPTGSSTLHTPQTGLTPTSNPITTQTETASASILTSTLIPGSSLTSTPTPTASSTLKGQTTSFIPTPNPISTLTLTAASCNEASWPDQNAVCGECKVLVTRFASHYKTCAGYCHSLGLGCVGAWEEDSDTCKVEAAMSCDEERSTTDAICECTRPVVSAPSLTSNPAPTALKCNASSWPNTSSVCSDCRVLVDHFNSHYKTCAGYCSSLGRGCVGAGSGLVFDSGSKKWNSKTCEVEVALPCNQTADTQNAVCECESLRNASCIGFSCPPQMALKPNSASIPCKTSPTISFPTCPGEDRDSCCMVVTTSTTTSAPANCASYNCPQSYSMRASPETILCHLPVACNNRDRDLCCFTEVPSAGVSTTLAAAANCASYHCQQNYVLRASPETILCHLAASCGDLDRDLCCVDVGGLSHVQPGGSIAVDSGTGCVGYICPSDMVLKQNPSPCSIPDADACCLLWNASALSTNDTSSTKQSHGLSKREKIIGGALLGGGAMLGTAAGMLAGGIMHAVGKPGQTVMEPAAHIKSMWPADINKNVSAVGKPGQTVMEPAAHIKSMWPAAINKNVSCKTKLKENHMAGSATLHLVDQSCLRIGDHIFVGNESQRTVISFGSVIIDRPIMNFLEKGTEALTYVAQAQLASTGSAVVLKKSVAAEAQPSLAAGAPGPPKARAGVKWVSVPPGTPKARAGVNWVPVPVPVSPSVTPTEAPQSSSIRVSVLVAICAVALVCCFCLCLLGAAETMRSSKKGTTRTRGKGKQVSPADLSTSRTLRQDEHGHLLPEDGSHQDISMTTTYPSSPQQSPWPMAGMLPLPQVWNQGYSNVAPITKERPASIIPLPTYMQSQSHFSEEAVPIYVEPEAQAMLSSPAWGRSGMD